LEKYFKDRREEEIKSLLEKMAADEQAAITRLIEKHSQEMLLMIQEKVCSLIVLSPPDSVGVGIMFSGCPSTELSVRNSFVCPDRSCDHVISRTA